TRTILHAHGGGALEDVISRRYTLAFNVMRRGLMPFATAIAILTVAYGIRYRERVYAAIAGNAAYEAAFWGGLAAGIAGSLFNDSGALLLMFSTFVLVVTTAYLRGGPEPSNVGAGG